MYFKLSPRERESDDDNDNDDCFHFVSTTIKKEYALNASIPNMICFCYRGELECEHINETVIKI